MNLLTLTSLVGAMVLMKVPLALGGEISDEQRYLGYTPPGLTAEIFASELFAYDESAGCSGFLDAGKVFVFSSMVKGSNWRFKPVYVMRFEDGAWSEPELAPFNGYMPYNFTVGPTGRTLYFTSLKSPDKTTSEIGENSNIWAVTLTGEGWTEPVMLGASINTEAYSENYPAVATDGTVYYMSNRDSTTGTDIWRSRARDNGYREAENLGPPVNSNEADQDPYIAPDSSYLIVCLTGREDSLGSYDLYVSFPQDDGDWSEPVNLGQGINSAGPEFRPYVSPDGKYLFFTALSPEGGDVGRIFWVSSEVISLARGSVN